MGDIRRYNEGWHLTDSPKVCQCDSLENLTLKVDVLRCGPQSRELLLRHLPCDGQEAAGGAAYTLPAVAPPHGP